MPLRRTDVTQVFVVEVHADLRLDVRAARCHQLAAAVDDADHVRFGRLQALHVRVHRDRAELALQRGLDPIHGQVGLGGGYVGIVNRLHQQALAETGTGVGLVILQVGAVGLGVAAVDDAQRNIVGVGNARGIAASDRLREHAVQRRNRRRSGGYGAAGY